MKKLRIGMIGYAFMGKAHSNAWRQVTRFFELPFEIELHTICGRNQEKLQQAAKDFSWKHTESDWRKVVENPEIDVIDINTPNDTHAEIAIEAARNGKAILCEKPQARNVEEAKAMFESARENKVVHMLCHNYRRIPAIALAKKLISEGALGEKIFHFHARYAQDWLVDEHFPRTWRMQKELAGSGAHGDINAHIIDLAHYLLGPIRELVADMHTFTKERPLVDDPKKMGSVDVDDAVHMLARFEQGCMGSFEATRFATGRKNNIRIEVNGSGGSIAFDAEDMNRLSYFSLKDSKQTQGFRSIIVTESDHPYAGKFWPPGHIIGYEHTFIHTIADFLHAIEKNSVPHPSFEDGLLTQKVLDAAEKSTELRQWVAVD